MSADDPRLAGLGTPLQPARRTTSVAPPPPPPASAERPTAAEPTEPAADAPDAAAAPTAPQRPPAPRPTRQAAPAAASTAGGRVSSSLPPELDAAFRQRAIDDETTQGDVLLAALAAHGADVVANPPKKPLRTGDAVLRYVFLPASGMATVEDLLSKAPAGRLNRSLLIRHCLQRYLQP